jgi:hypothetical protein
MSDGGVSRHAACFTYRKRLKSSFSPASCRFCTSAKTPKKCVGTPCRAEHRSCTMASTIALGSYVSEGYTIQDPCDHAARLPRTRRAKIQDKNDRTRENRNCRLIKTVKQRGHIALEEGKHHHRETQRIRGEHTEDII